MQVPDMDKKARPGRRAYHHGDLRGTLLRTVLDVARENGVAGVTMRSVAARSGVSESAAYHHFGGKADLLAAAAVIAFGDFSAALKTGIDSQTGDKRDPALGLADGYVRFALGDPGGYQLIFGRHIVEAGLDTREDVRAVGGESIEIALSALAESLSAREKRTSAGEVFPLVRAVMHGVVALISESELGENVPIEDAVALAWKGVDALLNGVD